MDHQVTTDGRTVWVNSGKTSTNLGRFSPVGFEVHTELDTHGKQTPILTSDMEHTHGEKWDLFVETVLEHHGVYVEASNKPKWVTSV